LSHCNRGAGLVVLNGSPLSYWAGEANMNPMRLGAGFTGGVWPAHWLADLGAGRFDGAWLVQNFEVLRPEGVWKKYDALFANPEREHDRFLEFERWWNACYFLGREEIIAILQDLFVGNRLENGEVVVDGHCKADLKRIRAPLVLFSSQGDNITPPHQALGWLRAVFPTTEALVDAGQRIVYLVHLSVGHLGIFVSADVALREHRAILHHAAKIQSLAPGLYEMLLEDGAEPMPARVRFVPRRLEDMPYDPVPAGFDKVDALVAPAGEASMPAGFRRSYARYGQARIDFEVGCRGAEFACPQCGAARNECMTACAGRGDTRTSSSSRRGCTPTRRVWAASGFGKTTQMPVPWAREGICFTLLFEALALSMCQGLAVRQAAQMLRVRDKQLWRRIDHYVGEPRRKQDISKVTFVEPREMCAMRCLNAPSFILIFSAPLRPY
jgi:hypothetical protein